MKINRKFAIAGVTGVMVASLALGAGPAMADPGSGVYRPLTGTGSDTTMFVLDALGNVVVDGSSNKLIASYDAVNPTSGAAGDLIQTRSAGTQFNRPNGSGAGVKALTASINPTGTYTWPKTVSGVTTQVSIAGQLDFARSSSGPSGSGSDLTYIPFGKDAVSYAYSNVGSASVPSNLTTAQLANIFKGVTTTYVGADTLTHSYVPILPQANSGTRSFFLGQLGLTASDVAWITTSVQENDGTVIDAVGKIAPFSVAQYISQSNSSTTGVPDTISGNDVKVGSIGGTAPIISGSLNTSFPLARNVYNVVQTSRLTGTSAADLQLQSVFKGSTSKVCAANTTITTFGFGSLGASCGSTTVTGPYVAP